MDNKIQLAAEVVSDTQKGRKIDTIKKLREISSIGLKESKAMVDLYSAQHNIKIPAISSGSAVNLIKTIKGLMTVAVLAYLADTFIL